MRTGALRQEIKVPGLETAQLSFCHIPLVPADSQLTGDGDREGNHTCAAGSKVKLFRAVSHSTACDPAAFSLSGYLQMTDCLEEKSQRTNLTSLPLF